MSDDYESPPLKIVGTLSCIAVAVERYEALLAAEAERDALRGLLAAVMRNVTAMPVQLARRIDAALAKGEE